MRLFVLCENGDPGADPYIVAEVARDATAARELSLAYSLAGARAQVLTRIELESTPLGRAALEFWDARDDDAFDIETEFLRGTSRGPLRAVARAKDDA